MPFKLIKGSFHIKDYSPDGDSIRFQPDNVGLIHDLAGSRPRINARNHVQLRIEAIDSLETHYSPPSGGGALHQPLLPAHQVIDHLLGFVGIDNVQWDENHLTVISANDGVAGYILARTIEKNGRPVAFVYAGDAPEGDGSEVHLDTDRLKESYNYSALAEGNAYPTYYRGLFNDLREALTEAANKARQQGLGIYAIDKTTDGFSANTLQSITQDHAILPKLFRRLSEYMVFYGTAVGFKQKMAQSKEPVLDLTTANFTHFDTFIEQDEDSPLIRLTRRPEELVFDEMPTRPTDAFSALMGRETAAPPELMQLVNVPVDAVRSFAF